MAASPQPANGQRERVLRAAMEAFAAQGFRGASLDDVAAAVGLTRQGLLHYFPSKVHLLLGVLDLREEHDSALVARLLERSDRLLDGLLALVAHNQESPGLARLFTVLAAESVDADHPGHERFRSRYRDVRARMAAELEREQRAGRVGDALPAAALATLLVAVMDGLQLQFLLDPEEVDMAEPFAALIALLSARRA